jgi:modulator of FtsH protease HflC
MRRGLIVIFSLVVLAVLFVVLCTFVRKPYEQVLLVRFGHIIEEKDQARLAYNWYFKMPTDTVVRIDTRLHLFTSPLIQGLTNDNFSIAVRTFAAWRITNPRLFYTSAGGDDARAMKLLSQKVTGLVQGEMAQHPLDEIFNTDLKKVKTGEIEHTIAEQATNGSAADAAAPEGQSKGLAEQGIQIVQVGLARLAFPPSNAEAVYMRMASERIRQAEAFRSEGIAAAANIKNEGAVAAAGIRAEAVKQAEGIRGEGDSEALKILAGVQSDASARDFYQYVKIMDLYRSAFNRNMYLVLPANSDLLKNLFVSPAAPVTGGSPAPAPKK